jgi:pilus assembly protein Flp/PilA
MHTQLQERWATSEWVAWPEIKPLWRNKMEFLRKMWRDDEGQDLIEYALIAALIAVALSAGLIALRGSISNVFTSVSGAMS